MNNLVKFSDGDGSGLDTSLEYVTIEPTENGYIIYVTDDEGDTKQVFEYANRKQMMKFIGGVLGV